MLFSDIIEHLNSGIDDEVDDIIVRELRNDRVEDTARFLAAVLGVYEDNQPAPENIPKAYGQENDRVSFGEWNLKGLCHRSCMVGANKKATL